MRLLKCNSIGLMIPPPPPPPKKFPRSSPESTNFYPSCCSPKPPPPPPNSQTKKMDKFFTQQPPPRPKPDPDPDPKRDEATPAEIPRGVVVGKDGKPYVCAVRSLFLCLFVSFRSFVRSFVGSVLFIYAGHI